MGLLLSLIRHKGALIPLCITALLVGNFAGTLGPICDKPISTSPLLEYKITYRRRPLTLRQAKRLIRLFYRRRRSRVRLLRVAFCCFLAFVAYKLFSSLVNGEIRDIGSIPLVLILGGLNTGVLYEDEHIAALNCDGTISLEIKHPVHIVIPRDSGLREVMAIALANMKFPLLREKPRRVLTHKAIGACVGLPSNQIGQLLQRVERHDMQEQTSYPEGELLDPALTKVLLGWITEGRFLSCEEFARLLIEGGYVKEVSPAAIRKALSQVDLNELLPKMRKLDIGPGSTALQYMVDQLLYVIDKKLLSKVKDIGDNVLVQIEEIRSRCKSRQSNPRGPYNWDQEKAHPMTERRRWYKLRKLEDWLSGRGQIIRCPVCGSTHVGYKQSRKRGYKDKDGKDHRTVAVSYYCKNPACKVVTFTVLPWWLELYARVTSSVAWEALLRVFHFNASLRHAVRELFDDASNKAGVAASSVWRWIQRWGRDLVEWNEVFGTRTCGVIAVDEKYVKIRGIWHYVFIAVDTESLDVLEAEIFPTRDTNAAKTFLGKLKATGYQINVIITDGNPAYEKAIQAVYPEAKHQKCIFHVERGVKDELYKAIGSRKDPRYKELATKVGAIFRSQKVEAFETAWNEWVELKAANLDLKAIFESLQKERDWIRETLLQSKIPRTSNAVERVIEEFDRKYDAMQSFMSLPSARAWTKLIQLYFRMRAFERGRRKGLSPVELLGYPVEGLDWREYIVGVGPKEGGTGAA